jgi:hypothetical protein
MKTRNYCTLNGFLDTVSKGYDKLPNLVIIEICLQNYFFGFKSKTLSALRTNEKTCRHQRDSKNMVRKEIRGKT